ncbi:hypothetical protein V7139_03585 [Neobacillus drentensis]
MKKRKCALQIIGGIVLVFLIATVFDTLTVKTQQPTPKPTKLVINE